MTDDQKPELPADDQAEEDRDAIHASQNINVFSSGNVIQSGDVRGQVTFFTDVTGPEKDEDDAARSRQSFLFDFYRQALRQADTTFRMSGIFMSIGAAIVLTGGILALIHFGSIDHNNISLLTALSGLVVGSCGGAFAIHANRARKHLTRQAEKIENDLQRDRKLEQTLRLIDQVGDAELRDRLKSVTAMRVLDLGPDPENIANHLLARREDSHRELPSKKPGTGER